MCGDDYVRGTVFLLLQHVLVFLSVVVCPKSGVWPFADGVWCGWGGRGVCFGWGGVGVFLLSVQHCGEYISTVFGYI